MKSKIVKKPVVDPSAKALEGLYLSTDGRTYKLFDLTIPNKINNLKEESFRLMCMNGTTKFNWTFITVTKMKSLIGFKTMKWID